MAQKRFPQQIVLPQNGKEVILMVAIDTGVGSAGVASLTAQVFIHSTRAGGVWMVLELVGGFGFWFVCNLIFLITGACLVLLTHLTNSYFPPHPKDSSLEDGGGGSASAPSHSPISNNS